MLPNITIHATILTEELQRQEGYDDAPEYKD
jgi:hypothetical protein